jgi:hypothetical protein
LARGGMGGCALNPRLLFPNTPLDINTRPAGRSKTY